jgi:PAS domain S-box-containing protein
MPAKDENNDKQVKKPVNEKLSDPQAPNTELKESEDRYHKMVDEVQDYAIILLDKHGIIQNWNKEAQTIKQYSESEAVGQSFKIFYLPEDKESKLPDRLMQEAVENGRAIHEGWRLRKDGTKFWGSVTLTALHDSNNEVIGFSKVTRDLTERKSAEDKLLAYTKELQEKNEELRRSEERYHNMVSEVQDYAIILLDEKGFIQNWNVGAQKIKGYSPEEIIGNHFEIFYPLEDRQRKLPHILLNEAKTKGKATHEGWRVRKDGTKFWGSIVITAIHSSDGVIIGFTKVTRDLTERKLAEDRMAAYLQELETQNRDLGQFAFVASHDLQEPLRKIRTFIEVLEENLADEAATRKYLEKIDSSAQRMSLLIKSVLNYSRITKEGEQFEETDLNALLTNVLADFELLIQEKKAEIKSSQLPTIECIPQLINQVFGNLISNALKFSEKNPVINISSKRVLKAQVVNPPNGPMEESYTEISFQDEGIGFDQQFETKVFTMFQRLHGKHEYTGTGIGLALCKRIMERHRGFISVRSEVSKGSTFYIYFPDH